MSTTASTYPAPRVTPNLRSALGGIWRLTLRRFMVPAHWATVLGLCLLLIPMSMPAAPSVAAAAKGFIPWVIGFYLTFIVPLMAFITAAGAMRDEMKAGNVDYVFTRPIPRPAFIGFKFLSHVGCAQLDFLLSFAAIVALGLYRQVPNLWAAVPALLGTQILVVIAFSAFGFLCGIITTRYIIVGLAYAAVIEVGVGQIPTQLNKISMTHQVQAALKKWFIESGDVPMAPNAANLPDVSIAATITLLLGFTAICLFIAGAIFSFRELAGPNES
jgi:ABC-2 type transport system permease protein